MAHRVCPWWLGYLLACPLRRWLQQPGAIVGPFLSDGMTVLEAGPGMGFFTLDMAQRVGPKGRVIAIDVQPQMVAALVRRARKAGLAARIVARLPEGDHLGVGDCQGHVDFALAFAVVHEVLKPDCLFGDLALAVKPGGRLLLAEPSGHVTAEAFLASLGLARDAGFTLESRPVIRRSLAAVMVRG